MKANKIYFERTKSLIGFHNVRVGIELQVEKGEKAPEVLKKAELFVAHALNESPTSQQMEAALNLVEHKKEIDELPF
jgi:hypothetical protein